jgi:hypothetical protein
MIRSVIEVSHLMVKVYQEIGKKLLGYFTNMVLLNSTKAKQLEISRTSTAMERNRKNLNGIQFLEVFKM